MNSSGIDVSEINAIALSTPWNVQKLSQSDLFKDIGAYQKIILEHTMPHHCLIWSISFILA